MIKTLIIDDEPLALQQLAVYVSKVPFLTLVGECQSALEARDIINNERVDVIFIDINMPDLNGMDFVPVPYTHLTLPTKRIVSNSAVAVSYK